MNISWQLVRNSTNEPTTKKENSNKNIAHQFTQSSIELSFDLLRVLGLLVGGLLAEHVQVVLLEEAQVLAGLSELALLHALADVPVHEGALRVHQVVLLADALAEHARHRRVVADHHHVAINNAVSSLSPTRAAGTSLRPTLKPVGTHSTNVTFLFVFSHCTVAFASLAFTWPR